MSSIKAIKSKTESRKIMESVGTRTIKCVGSRKIRESECRVENNRKVSGREQSKLKLRAQTIKIKNDKGKE